MSRIEAAFARIRERGRPGLVTYVTAGDPSLEQSAAILERLCAAGADVLEVGVPFSDPLADGPVIQRATERALAGGATLAGVLDMVAGVRGRLSAPVVIFTYANPVLRMGLDVFADRAARAGVDGVLTLDVPPEEADGLRSAFSARGIDTIFLLSPTTTSERIRAPRPSGAGSCMGSRGSASPERATTWPTRRRHWPSACAPSPQCRWHSGSACRGPSTFATSASGPTPPWSAARWCR
ncbi:MAG: tryptophan synthase subunit alpha [Vicinamibacterales bacterium]